MDWLPLTSDLFNSLHPTKTTQVLWSVASGCPSGSVVAKGWPRFLSLWNKLTHHHQIKAQLKADLFFWGFWSFFSKCLFC